MSSSQRARRPSVSIYDYPEHLNPFNDDTKNSQSQMQYHEDKSSKESKHKFWTFGKSRKKRSNSFSIKSTWNGLFGKRKECSEPAVEKRSTITTVSTTYKRESYDRPLAPSRLSKDQQEFDEALDTLTRRRKYTLDNKSSRCNSTLTMNGDPAKIYDGNPQNTTTSIMGVDLTPKPPVRRFGQVSPRPTDKIPSLDFEDKHPKQNGDLHDKSERTPVPPMRRFGNRSSQRLNGPTSDLEEDPVNRSDGNVSLKDENENVPEDYVFKRFSQDAVRKSNLSINSCISVTSTASTYGRKKRRAPQPPKQKEQLEISLESNGQPETNKTESTPDTSKIELQIIEPIDITKATENINEMTKKSCEELSEQSSPKEEKRDESSKTAEDTSSDDIFSKSPARDETCEVLKDCVLEVNEKKDPSEERSTCNFNGTSENVELVEEKSEKEQSSTITKDTIEKDPVSVEYNRTSQEKLEIIKDVDQESDEVCLRKKDSSGTLSRSESFSVKEEIEKIEKQIKALESKNASKEQEKLDDDQVTNARLSIQANRRHFFENMVDNPPDSVKLEFKKLPCEQKDIHVVRLTDSPIPIATPRDTVKVIELHISEPIRHKPELLDEVNPIPKPRRHSALSMRNMSESRLSKNGNNKSLEENGKRGSF